jgi:hypothetical protein
MRKMKERRTGSQPACDIGPILTVVSIEIVRRRWCTPFECNTIFAVDSYTVRRLLVSRELSAHMSTSQLYVQTTTDRRDTSLDVIQLCQSVYLSFYLWKCNQTNRVRSLYSCDELGQYQDYTMTDQLQHQSAIAVVQ